MGPLGARLGLTRYEADELYRIALNYRVNRNLEQAILTMNRALELLPFNAEYYAARGLFYFQDGNREKAEEDFDASLRYNAYEMLANYGKGMLAYQDKHFETALAHFTTAWAVTPQRPEILHYLALTEHRLRNNDRALAYMRQALILFTQAENKAAIRNAERWISEFEKLLSRQQVLLN